MSSGPALRVASARLHAYRRTWQSSLAVTFANPVLVLLAMGLGLGTLVDRSPTPALSGLSYVEFLAPGLLAATAMQLGAAEGAWPLRLGIKWQKTYHAAVATPIRPRDLVVGNLVWTGGRLVLAGAVFVLVMTVFGVGAPVSAALALAPAVLTGVAFAAAVMAFVATTDSDLAVVGVFRFGIMPLFLFSGTFFPIDQLPAVLQPVARLTPLWHGVELCRAATLGLTPAWPAAVHAGYLALWAGAGTLLAVRALQQRLIR
jgi:lipooligosaccharide transport system permease protein